MNRNQRIAMKQMPIVRIISAIALWLIMGMSQVMAEYAQPVGPAFTFRSFHSGSGLRVQDVSPDGKYILVYADSVDQVGEDSFFSDSFPILINVETEQYVYLTTDHNGDVIDHLQRDMRLAFIADTQQVAFVTDKALLEELQESTFSIWMYIYDIATDTLSYRDIPDDFFSHARGSYTRPSPDGRYLFFGRNYNDQFALYDMVSDEWTFVPVLPDVECSSFVSKGFLDWDNNNNLYFAHECNTDNTTYIRKLTLDDSEGTSITSVYQFSEARYYHNTTIRVVQSTGEVILHHEDTQQLVKISPREGEYVSNPLIVPFLTEEHAFPLEFSDYTMTAVSSNGEQLLFRTGNSESQLFDQDGETQITRTAWNLLSANLTNNKTALLNASPQGRFNQTFNPSISIDNDSVVYFTAATGGNRERQIYRVDLSDSLYAAPASVSSLEVHNEGPLRNSIRIDSDARHFIMERHNLTSGVTDKAILHGNQIQDYRFNLDVGSVNYAIKACSEHFVCTESYEEVQLDTQDFPKPADIQLLPLDYESFSASHPHFYSASSDLRLSASVIAEADLLLFEEPAINDSSFRFRRQIVKSDTASIIPWEVDAGTNVLYARYCLRNFNTELSCGGNYSEPVIYQSEFTPDVLTYKAQFLDSLELNWQHPQGATATIFKNNSANEWVALAENLTSGEYVDKQVVPGEKLRYSIDVCTDIQCQRRYFEFHNTQTGGAAIRTAWYNANPDPNPANIVMNIVNTYQFDSIRLYRRADAEDSPFELVADLNYKDRVLIDTVPVVNTDYVYRLESCFDNGVCSTSDTDIRTYVRATDLLYKPAIVDDVKLEKGHQGARLSWTPSSDVDGYNIYFYYDDRPTVQVQLPDPNTASFDFAVDPEKKFRVAIKSYAIYDYHRWSHSDPVTFEVDGLEQLSFTNLLSPGFELTRDPGNGFARIRFTNQSAYDALQIWYRTDEQQEFTLLKVTRSNLNRLNLSSFPDGTVLHYRVIGCSELTDTCSEPSATQAFLVREDFAVPVLDTPPDLAYEEGVGIIVTANVPQHDLIEEIRFSGSDGRTVYGTERTMVLPESSIIAGREYFFVTSYCYMDSSFSRRCTSATERSYITAPDTVPQLIRAPGLRIISVESNGETASVHVEIDLHSDGLPLERVNLKLVSAQGERRFVLQQELEEGLGETINHTITNLDLQDVYGLELETCIAARCSQASYSTFDTFIWQPQIPEAPTNFVVLDTDEFDRVMLMFKTARQTDSVRVAWGTDPGNLNRRFSTSQFVFHNNEFYDRLYIDDLALNTPYYFAVAGCNELGCSENSEVVAKTTGSWQTTEFSLSLDTLFGQYNNGVEPESPYWKSDRQGSIRPNYGRMNTYVGEFETAIPVYLASGVEFSVEVHIPQLNTSYYCEEFFKQSITSSNLTRSSNPIVDPLFSMFVAPENAACNSQLDLDSNSLYLFSPYLEAPVVLDSALSGTWAKVVATLGENGNLSIRINDNVAIEFASQVPLELFDSAFLRWEIDSSYSAITDLVIKANQNPVSAIEQTFASRISFRVQHPRFLVLRGANTEADSLEVGERSELTYTPHSYQQRKVSGVNYLIIDDLRPATSYAFWVKECVASHCQPASYFERETESYREITSWNRPYASMGLQPGVAEVTLQVSSTRHADSFVFNTLNESGEVIQTQEFSFADILSRENYQFGSTIMAVVQNLTPSERYRFELQVCNPIGCFTTDSSNDFIPDVDSDGDGIVDSRDRFPDDPNEWFDTDYDGIGNNADTDDDGDGIPDTLEEQLGLDPLNSQDAYDDLDQDGFTNAMEYHTNTAINDGEDNIGNGRFFFSFEEDGSDPTENVVMTNTEIVRSLNFPAPHGDQVFKAAEMSSPFEISVTGTLENALFGFTSLDYIDYIRSGDVTILIDDQEVESTVSEGYLVNYGYRWYSITLDESLAGRKAKLTLRISRSYAFNRYFDTFLLPLTSDSEKRVVADFDGDGKAELVIRDTDSFTNFVKNIASQSIDRITFGRDSGEIPVEGDFDGDKKADIAVRRPSNHMWYIRRSSDSEIQRIQFGRDAADIPVPADYDGDGITDIAVRRPGNTTWYIRNSSGVDPIDGNRDGISRVRFGLQSEDIPVPADYDGDGKADIAVRRASNQMWYILQSSNGEIRRENFGKQVADIPVPSDYDGDGKADVAVRRGNNFHFYILQSSDNMIRRVVFGRNTGDIPVVADYDGDGKADISVRRGSNYHWYIYRSTDEEIGREVFGRDASYMPLLAPVDSRMNWHNRNRPSSDTESEAEQVFYDEQLLLEDFLYISEEQADEDTQIR